MLLSTKASGDPEVDLDDKKTAVYETKKKKTACYLEPIKLILHVYHGEPRVQQQGNIINSWPREFPDRAYQTIIFDPHKKKWRHQKVAFDRLEKKWIFKNLNQRQHCKALHQHTSQRLQTKCAPM